MATIFHRSDTHTVFGHTFNANSGSKWAAGLIPERYSHFKSWDLDLNSNGSKSYQHTDEENQNLFFFCQSGYTLQKVNWTVY